MGKGTTTSTRIIPPELSGLYSQSARGIQTLQNALPLAGSMGGGGAYPVGPGRPDDVPPNLVEDPPPGRPKPDLGKRNVL